MYSVEYVCFADCVVSGNAYGIIVFPVPGNKKPSGTNILIVSIFPIKLPVNFTVNGDCPEVLSAVRTNRGVLSSLTSVEFSLHPVIVSRRQTDMVMIIFFICDIAG